MSWWIKDYYYRNAAYYLLNEKHANDISLVLFTTVRCKQAAHYHKLDNFQATSSRARQLACKHVFDRINYRNQLQSESYKSFVLDTKLEFFFLRRKKKVEVKTFTEIYIQYFQDESGFRLKTTLGKRFRIAQIGSIIYCWNSHSCYLRTWKTEKGKAQQKLVKYLKVKIRGHINKLIEKEIIHKALKDRMFQLWLQLTN